MINIPAFWRVHIFCGEKLHSQENVLFKTSKLWLVCSIVFSVLVCTVGQISLYWTPIIRLIGYFKNLFSWWLFSQHYLFWITRIFPILNHKALRLLHNKIRPAIYVNTYKYSVVKGVPEGIAAKFLSWHSTLLALQLQSLGQV